MITTTLNSTFLQEATYDSSRRMLTVVFKNGRTYSYQNVDKTVYDGLINTLVLQAASSVQTFVVSSPLAPDGVKASPAL